MNEIKCPKCGKVFQIDEGDYAQIAAQVRDEVLTKELSKREKEIQEQYELKLRNAEETSEHFLEKKLSEQQSKIDFLTHSLETAKKDGEIAVSDAVKKVEKENIELKSKLEASSQGQQIAVSEAVKKNEEEINELRLKLIEAKHELMEQESKQKLDISKIKASHDLAIKEREDQIAYYKELKIKTNVKLLGETLEQHCMIAFNQIRSAAFPRAYFEKDNDVMDGTKGDFVFKDYDENGHEFISILFEMKNEGDETATKHTNESFFKKLDDDRIKKGCEYAVLVSVLEKDNEYYNYGIVDVSYKYAKMYVIRPQFFIPLITVLRNSAMKTINAIISLEQERQRNIDIHAFQDNLLSVQKVFDKHYGVARKQFDDAITRIDNAIEQLQKLKSALDGCGNNLRLANNNVQELSMGKLVKNSPTLAAQLNAIDEDKK